MKLKRRSNSSQKVISAKKENKKMMSPKENAEYVIMRSKMLP